MSSPRDITIIIPFLNEAENLPMLASELSAFFTKNNTIAFDIILVDDGSTDDSLHVLADLKFACAVKVISLSRNFGSHAALRAGLQHAQANYVCFLYADLQDPVENLITMHRLATTGNDIVWGIRKTVQSSGFERLFSSLYARLMKRFVNPAFPEKGFDIVMLSQKVVQVINQNVEANSSIFLQLLNLGFSQGEVEYEKKDRRAGKSKWTLAKKIKLVVDSFVAFSYAPIRFVTYAGFAMFLIGIFWTIYIITRKLIYNDLESGWPMLTSILFLGFGLTNISLGILAEYLWRTLDASRKRPVFVIDKIIEIGASESKT